MKDFFGYTDINAYFEACAQTVRDDEAQRRKEFFEALGKKDDGRLSPVMTREEFYTFIEDRHVTDDDLPENARCVEVFYEFLAYETVVYLYCFDDAAVYVNTYYVGD